MIKLKSLIENKYEDKLFLFLKVDGVEIPFTYVGGIMKPPTHYDIHGSWIWAWRYNKVFTKEQIQKILKRFDSDFKSAKVVAYATLPYYEVVNRDGTTDFDDYEYRNRLTYYLL